MQSVGHSLAELNFGRRLAPAEASSLADDTGSSARVKGMGGLLRCPDKTLAASGLTWNCA